MSTYEFGGLGAMAALTAMNGLPSVHDCGYGSKILLVTAYMLEKAAVWPGKHTTEGGFMNSLLIKVQSPA